MLGATEDIEQIRELKEKILQLERDLADMRKPVQQRSTEELTQGERDTLSELFAWLETNRDTVICTTSVSNLRLLRRLYETRATELQVLRVAHSKAKADALAEHKRADEAVLDLHDEVGRNRAELRLCIVRYLEHLATPEEAAKLCSIDSAALSTVAEWIRKGHDLDYESERQSKLSDGEVMLGVSWEEKCIYTGHAPGCEKIYYEHSNLCTCGRELWDRAQRQAKENEDDGEEGEENSVV